MPTPPPARREITKYIPCLDSDTGQLPSGQHVVDVDDGNIKMVMRIHTHHHVQGGAA